MSTKNYVVMFMLVALIPFGYAFLFGYCSIPPDKSTYNVSAIQTESVASILDLDLTSVHSFPGFITTDKVGRILLLRFITVQLL